MRLLFESLGVRTSRRHLLSAFQPSDDDDDEYDNDDDLADVVTDEDCRGL